MSLPVYTGRKLNVHKTFRRRLGRLLNVLYMFNLRPVSTGLTYDRYVVVAFIVDFEFVFFPRPMTCSKSTVKTVD